MKAILIIIPLLIIAIVGGLIVLNEKSNSKTPQTLLSPQETAPPSPAPASSSATISDAPAVSVVAEGLDTPWAIAFLPDGGILVTERVGRLRLINKSGTLEPQAIAVPNVREIGEGGLLGIALHPDFAKNHQLYLYYTYRSNGANTQNRVVRMTYENNKLSEEEIIVDKIPGGTNHDGGRIKFGPDKFLYITTGDSGEPSLAQNKTSLAGKILRVTEDGKPAPGNPFNTQSYSYGHRNPQGIAWDKTGQLWETEHGRSLPSGYDEINLIKPGQNYGWPTIEGDKTKSGMIVPVKNSGASTTWAPAGAAFVGDSLFYGGLKGQTLYEAVISGNQITDFKEHFANTYGRIREVILGPDNLLYITTSNQDGRGTPQEGDDKILKINPSKL